MPLGSISNAYEVWKDHDFSRNFQFRIISMDGVPDYVVTELIEKPIGLGGWLYWTSASIPGRKVEDVPVKYQGFTFHMPGAAVYDQPNPWKVKFKTPGDFLVRNALERWNFEIYNDETSCGNFSIPCPATSIDIGLLDNKCRIVRQYRLIGVYPSSISSIEYSQEDTNITSFDVDFFYQFWRPVPVDLSILDDGTVPIVDSVYENYHRQIANNKDNCGTSLNQLNSL